MDKADGAKVKIRQHLMKKMVKPQIKVFGCLYGSMMWTQYIGIVWIKALKLCIPLKICPGMFVNYISVTRMDMSLESVKAWRYNSLL